MRKQIGGDSFSSAEEEYHQQARLADTIKLGLAFAPMIVGLCAVSVLLSGHPAVVYPTELRDIFPADTTESHVSSARIRSPVFPDCWFDFDVDSYYTRARINARCAHGLLGPSQVVLAAPGKRFLRPAAQRSISETECVPGTHFFTGIVTAVSAEKDSYPGGLVVVAQSACVPRYSEAVWPPIFSPPLFVPYEILVETGAYWCGEWAVITWLDTGRVWPQAHFTKYAGTCHNATEVMIAAVDRQRGHAAPLSPKTSWTDWTPGYD